MNSVESAQFGADKNPNLSERPKYLVKRRGYFWFKRKYPRDVALALKKRNGDTRWRSLRTRDECEAREKLGQELAKFEHDVQRARETSDPQETQVAKAQLRAGGTDKYLLPEHIPVILSAYEAQTLIADDEMRASIGAMSEPLAAKLSQLEKLTDLVRARLLACKQARTMQLVEPVHELGAHLLSHHGLVSPPGTSTRERFLNDLLRTEVALLEERLCRSNGEGRRATPEPHVAALRARTLTTLRDAHTRWKQGSKRPKTVQTYCRCVAEFEAHVGVIPLVGLTPLHANAYRDWLKSRSIGQVTAKNRIAALATLFTHAVRKAERTDAHFGLPNPFERVSLDEFAGPNVNELRRPFTMSEIQHALNSDLYKGDFTVKGQAREALYWCIPVGLYAGPRIEEFAQLRTSDVQQVEGVWVFNFHGRVKTFWSSRLVPVHPELEKLGFIDYVLERKGDSSNLMLFPSLSRSGDDERWSAALSKAFARFLDHIGLTDSRLHHHSLRYVFRQQLANCGVDEEHAERLLGHRLELDKTSVYLTNQGALYPLPPLVESMKKLRYSELDFSHLSPQARLFD